MNSAKKFSGIAKILKRKKYLSCDLLLTLFEKVFKILILVVSNKAFGLIIGQNITADAIGPTYSKIVFEINFHQRFNLFIIYLNHFDC